MICSVRETGHKKNRCSEKLHEKWTKDSGGHQPSELQPGHTARARTVHASCPGDLTFLCAVLQKSGPLRSVTDLKGKLGSGGTAAGQTGNFF